jgi:hypothetical protein
MIKRIENKYEGHKEIHYVQKLKNVINGKRQKEK